MAQTVPFEQLVGGLLSVGDGANPQLTTYNYGLCPATGVRNGAGDVTWTLATAAAAAENSVKTQVRGTAAQFCAVEYVNATTIRTRVFSDAGAAVDAAVDLQIWKVRRAG